MITWPGIAEHRFRIVFNYQSFILLWYNIQLITYYQCVRYLLKNTTIPCEYYVQYMAWNYFGENNTPLQRNGIAANPKIGVKNKKCNSRMILSVPKYKTKMQTLSKRPKQTKSQKETDRDNTQHRKQTNREKLTHEKQTDKQSKEKCIA